jgi:hypothetical protein
VAEAVRDLAWRRESKRLTQKDEALLGRGLEFLAAEMAVATDTQVVDARERIDTALQVAIQNRLEDVKDTDKEGKTSQSSLAGPAQVTA